MFVEQPKNQSDNAKKIYGVDGQCIVFLFLDTDHAKMNFDDASDSEFGTFKAATTMTCY